MITASLTIEDEHLRDAVLRRLQRNSRVDHSAIDVTVDDGVVTLTGVVDSDAGKRAAERAIKRVPGVWAVVNDLTVCEGVDWTDPDVAPDASQGLKLRPVFQRMFS